MKFASLVNAFGRSRLILSLLATIGFAIVGAGPSAQAASFAPLEIVTKSGVQVFSVEMATTEEEKTTGLMYRKELADGKGMLFDFSPEQQVSMWMKNTYVSLDMIGRLRPNALTMEANFMEHSRRTLDISGRP